MAAFFAAFLILAIARVVFWNRSEISLTETNGRLSHCSGMTPGDVRLIWPMSFFGPPSLYGVRIREQLELSRLQLMTQEGQVEASSYVRRRH
jgi:hypothetical protein